MMVLIACSDSAEHRLPGSRAEMKDGGGWTTNNQATVGVVRAAGSFEFHNDVTRGPTLFGQDQLHAAS